MHNKLLNFFNFFSKLINLHASATAIFHMLAVAVDDKFIASLSSSL